MIHILEYHMNGTPYRAHTTTLIDDDKLAEKVRDLVHDNRRCLWVAVNGNVVWHYERGYSQSGKDLFPQYALWIQRDEQEYQEGQRFMPVSQIKAELEYANRTESFIDDHGFAP